MGVCHYLHVGPYAEWRRPGAREDRGFPPPVRAAFERVTWDAGLLDYQHSFGDLLVEEVDGVPQFCYRFFPVFNAPGLPRPMLFADKGGADVGTLDLTDTDRAAEIEWFAATFRDPLADLAAALESPPALRWGLLTWRS